VEPKAPAARPGEGLSVPIVAPEVQRGDKEGPSMPVDSQRAASLPMCSDMELGCTMDDVPCGPFLVYKKDNGPARVLDLAGKNTVTLGRSEDCDFSFADTAVSRVHLVVEFKDRAWTMRDLRSTYGSYLEGGEKLSKPTVLNNGGRFRLGRRVVLLFCEAADLVKAFEENSNGISLPAQVA
jgi:hypothetical protein